MLILRGSRILSRRMMTGELCYGKKWGFGADFTSLRCVQLIAGTLGRAGEDGQKKRLEAAKTGKVTWASPQGLGDPVDMKVKTDEKSDVRSTRGGAKVAEEENDDL